jgi:hypothetical protein
LFLFCSILEVSMIAANFVDGFIPDWQLPDDGRHSITAEVGIVYKPDIQRHVFERSCGQLEGRRQAYLAQLNKNRRPDRPLYAIDQKTVTRAREAIGRDTNTDYLDRFMFDTEKAATAEVGKVMDRAKRAGLSVVPAHARDAVDVLPGRSFSSNDARLAFEAGAKIKWTPTVRLSVRVNFEGNRDAVETAVSDLRSAMLFCGPVTTFNEHADVPMKHLPLAAMPTLVAV